MIERRPIPTTSTLDSVSVIAAVAAGILVALTCVFRALWAVAGPVLALFGVVNLTASLVIYALTAVLWAGCACLCVIPVRMLIRCRRDKTSRVKWTFAVGGAMTLIFAMGQIA